MTPHIALVFKKFDADGGAERMAATLLGVCYEAGFRLTVIARDVPEGARDRWPDVEFIVCNPRYSGRTARVLGFAQAVQQRLAGLDVDLVFSQEPMIGCDIYRAGGGVYAEMRAQRGRYQSAPARLYGRAQRYHRKRLALESQLYASERLRAVVCNSAMVRDDIRRHYAVGDTELTVIENSIDIAAYAPDERARQSGLACRQRYEIPAHAMLLLFVGSGFERKGLAAAIRALAASRGQARLLVVGRDKSRRRYARLAQRCGVGDRVHFAGAQDDVRPFYWAADALIHPAEYEAFGLVVLEAMAAGLPVIASHTCGAALSLVEPGVNGFVASAADYRAQAAAINQLAATDERDGMQQAALRAAATHDLPVLRSQIERLVARLVAERASSPR